MYVFSQILCNGWSKVNLKKILRLLIAEIKKFSFEKFQQEYLSSREKDFSSRNT
jgi:hypothetical protein